MNSLSRIGSKFRTSGGEIITIAKIIPHNLYNHKTHDYDFSLLQLSRKIVFSPSKAKIALPLQNEPVPVGSLSLISGWGRFSYGGGSPISLRAAKVNIVNQALCNRAYNGGITTRMLCAAAKGKDACQG